MLSSSIHSIPTKALAAALAAVTALAGCAGVDQRAPKGPAHAEAQPSQAEIAGRDPVGTPGSKGAPPVAAASGTPEALPGVDTSDLVQRERHAWWQLVSELYAPCADQAVSLAQCVQERRACAACLPGAQLLATQIHGGASTSAAQAAYTIRFGPDVKTVDAVDAPARGPERAPVQIVVWLDYECPACRHAEPLLDAVVERYSPNVRLVHRFYPLTVHKRSDPAARAAFAAKQQGRYWDMDHLLFENQPIFEDRDLVGYAKKLGLDLRRFQADRTSDRAGEAIARDRAEAERDGLTGTPFILINGREFDLGHFSLQTDLEPWIATEIALARRAPAAAATR